MITIKSIFTAANINDAIRSIKDKVVEIFTQPAKKEDMIISEDVPIMPPTMEANTLRNSIDKINTKSRVPVKFLYPNPIPGKKPEMIENGGRVK